MIDEMIDYAKKFIGTPYLYGGNNPIGGIDCSGLICEVLRAHGFIGKEDLTAQEIYNRFAPKLKSQLGRGSLLFFGKSRTAISHVALCISDTLMIEAGGGDSTTVTENEAKKRNAFVRVRPVKYRSDITAFLKLE